MKFNSSDNNKKKRTSNLILCFGVKIGTEAKLLEVLNNIIKLVKTFNLIRLCLGNNFQVWTWFQIPFSRTSTIVQKHGIGIPNMLGIKF